MALAECRECKKEISDQALTCPNCGASSPTKAQLKQNQIIVGGCLSVLAIPFILIALVYVLPKAETTGNNPALQKTSPKLTRTQILDKQFSAWDGSHPGLTSHIKSSMNDPKSYEHVETKYWDREKYLIVQTTFRGKNAFGGVVLQSIKATVDLSGNVLDILEQN